MANVYILNFKYGTFIVSHGIIPYKMRGKTLVSGQKWEIMTIIA